MPIFKRNPRQKEPFSPEAVLSPEATKKRRELLAEVNNLNKLHANLAEILNLIKQADPNDLHGSEHRRLIKEANTLKERIEQAQAALDAKLWPYDKKKLSRESLKEQYQAQKDIFIKNKLIMESLPQSKKPGFIHKGTERPMPELEEILKRLKKDPQTRELIKTKLEQGFVRLQITPLIPIASLKDNLGQALIRHKREGKLFQTKKDPKDPDIPLDLDQANPVYVYERFKDDNLIYDPEEFSPDPKKHKGLTKDQLIEQTGGYLITLIEADPFLAQEGENITRGREANQRKRLENNQTPRQYLETIQKQKEYQGESGLTVEDWLTCFLINLEQTNQVSNDWNDNNAAWLIGNYLPPTPQELQADPNSSGGLPVAYWSRDRHRASVGWVRPGARSSGWGARSAVRIPHLLKKGAGQV